MADTDLVPLAVAPKAKPRRRRLGIALAVGAAVLAALAFAPAIVARTSLLNSFVAQATAGQIAGTVAVESASLGWFSPVELHGVRVLDNAGSPVLTAETVTVSRTLLDLARDSSDLGTISVSGTKLTVFCDATSTNVEKLLAPILNAPPNPGPQPRLEVQIADGTVVLRDATTESTFALVSANVRIRESTHVDAKLAHDEGTISVEADLGTITEVKLATEKLAAAAFAPLLPRFAPGTQIAGTVATKLEFRAGGTATLTGSAEVLGLDLSGPAVGRDRVKLARAAVPNLDLRFANGAIHLANTSLACDVGTATVTAVIDPSASPETILSRPGQSVIADVDLARLAALVPNLLRLHDGTELRSGRVNLTFATTATPTGTGWTGNLATTSLSGTRAGKPLAWDEPLKAEFAGHTAADGLPAFDKLVVQSDFVGVAARGSFEKFEAKANLDLAKLSKHLAEFVNLGGLTFAGTGTLDLAAAPRPGATGTSINGTASMKNFVLKDGRSLNLSEPTLTLVVKATGEKSGRNARLDSGEIRVLANGDEAAFVLASPVADLFAADTIRGKASLFGHLDRWRDRLVALGLIPRDWKFLGSGTVDADVFATTSGTLRGTGKVSLDAAVLLLPPTTKLEAAMIRGTVGFDVALGGKIGFDVDLNPEKVRYLSTNAPFAPPDWAEPWVKLKAVGTWDPKTDGLTVTASRVERVGLVAEAKGSVAKIQTVPNVDVSGTLSYDLAQLQPQLREYLGAGAEIAGKETRPFQLRGEIGNDGRNLKVAVGPRPGPYDSLSGSAGLGWDKVKAYGFDVGKADLKATVGHGLVNVSTLDAAFGGGKVKLTPTVKLDTFEMTLAPGRIVERAKLTPEACASAIGYALPPIAKAVKADGVVSLDLTECRMPLGDPTKASVKGTLTVHSATVSGGPLVTEILTLIGAKQTALTLASEQAVPIRVENGRVYHENLSLAVGPVTVKSSGSVGLDGSVATALDMPVPPQVVERLLARNPRLRDALAKQTIRVPVAGTLEKPQIDGKAFQVEMEKVLKAVAADTAKDLLGDLLFKRK